MFFEVLVVTSVAKTATEYASDGPDRFRQGEQVETATRKAMDVIQAKLVNANASTFEYFNTHVDVFASNDERFELAA